MEQPADHLGFRWPDFLRRKLVGCTIEPREGTPSNGAPGGSEDERVLRAKYLDWCSARLADVFVRLTPEEIYALAERAEATSSLDAAGEPLSFRALVERVTAVLTSEMSLPTFAEWVQAYTEDPARFEDELSGLWRDRA